MVLIESGLPFERLTVERFDYSPLEGEWSEWALVRLLAALSADAGAPSAAHLVIEAEPGARVSAAVETQATERRLRVDGAAGYELLWSAAFSVPLAAVESAPATFRLLAGERHPVAVTLPVPIRHVGFSPILSLRPHRPARARAIRPRQIAAVATSVAVTATSVPAVALATQVTTPSTTPVPAPSVTATTATTATAPTAAATATTPAPAAGPTATRARHHRAAHATAKARAPKPATVSETRAPAPRKPAAHRPAHTAAGASGCPTQNTHGPIAYAASGHASGAHSAVSCRVAAQPPTPTAGAAMSFGAGAAPATAANAPSTTSTTSTTTPAPTTPTAPSTTPTASTTTPSAPAQPGTPAVTPVTHHAAPAAHHAAHHPAHHTSGGAALAPTAPRSTSTPAPSAQQRTSSTTSTVTTLSSNPPGFKGPSSWTGTVQANPALTGAVTELSGLLSNGNRPPSFLIPIYMEAGRRYHVPWEVLAAINAIETDYGRNLNTSSAGAVGWMQFEPSTWAQYGMAVDGHSVPNPYDPRDAIFSAARYLAAAGAAQNVSRAVFAYNHASWYVDEVMSRASAIATHAQFERTTLQHGKFSVYFASGHPAAPKVRYTSGVLSHYDRLIAAANMVSAANFPYLWGGGHTQPARFGPFDCSGSVSYVMQQAGYQVPTSVSGNIGQWKLPAGPGQVTIFYNPTHTFMRIGNRYFGTSGFARPGGGAGWFDVDKLPASYLAQFSEVHVPGLGPNSFDGTVAPLVLTPLFHRHRHHHTTSTLSFLPLMSTLGPFPGTGQLPALPE